MYVYGYISDHLNSLAIRTTFHIRMNSNMPVRQRDCGGGLLVQYSYLPWGACRGSNSRAGHCTFGTFLKATPKSGSVRGASGVVDGTRLGVVCQYVSHRGVCRRRHLDAYPYFSNYTRTRNIR